MSDLAGSYGALQAQYRTERGISRYRLAHRCFLSVSFIGRLEAGNRTPSPETATLIADELQLDDLKRRRLLAAVVGIRLLESDAVAEPVEIALRAALNDPRIPDEAKSLMRQSVAALVATWTPKEDNDECNCKSRERQPAPVGEAAER